MKNVLKQVKDETTALVVAYADPRTPLYAKVWIVLVVAYAVSPIDLIPDFIPVIGYVDDVLILPVGISIAVKLVPGPVYQDAKTRTGDIDESYQYLGLGIVIGIWIILLVIMFSILHPLPIIPV